MFGVSLLFTILVQCFPYAMNYVTIILGSISILATIIILFLYPTNHVVTKYIFIGCLFMLLIVVCYELFLHWQNLKDNTIFLDVATKIVGENKLATFFAWLLFFASLVLCLVLLIFEMFAYWSKPNL